MLLAAVTVEGAVYTIEVKSDSLTHTKVGEHASGQSLSWRRDGAEFATMVMMEWLRFGAENRVNYYRLCPLVHLGFLKFPIAQR